MEKELIIDDTGWERVTCEKCGTTTVFHPDFPSEQQVCMECSPMALPKLEDE